MKRVILQVATLVWAYGSIPQILRPKETDRRCPTIRKGCAWGRGLKKEQASESKLKDSASGVLTQI